MDSLIDGHTHLVYYETTKDKDGKNVPFAQTETKLNNIGVFTIHTNGSISHENIENITFDPVLEQESLNITRGKKNVWIDREMNKYIND